jgi:hypothetical protein
MRLYMLGGYWYNVEEAWTMIQEESGYRDTL